MPPPLPVCVPPLDPLLVSRSAGEMDARRRVSCLTIIGVTNSSNQSNTTGGIRRKSLNRVLPALEDQVGPLQGA